MSMFFHIGTGDKCPICEESLVYCNCGYIKDTKSDSWTKEELESFDTNCMPGGSGLRED